MGLNWAAHKLFFLSWTVAGVGLGVSFYKDAERREEEYQKRRDFWMHCGHYKHPWESPNQLYNDPRAIEQLKGKDYVEFSKFPSGL